VFALLCTLVFAGDDDSKYKRTLKVVSSDAKKYELDSEERSETGRTKLLFGLYIDEQVDLSVKYEAKDKDSKDEVRYRVSFEKIVEYEEKNGVNGLQKEDNIVSTVDLESKTLSWKDIECIQDGDNYNCVVESTDTQFKLIVHLVAEVNDVDGYPVRPTSMKFDIVINKLARTPNTRLALLVKTKTKEQQITKEKSHEEEEGFTVKKEKQVSFGDNGFFSWVQTATVGGVAVNVFNSDLEEATDSKLDSDESCKRVTFSFDSTDSGKVEWDPKLAWDGDSSNSAIVVPSFALIAMLVLALFKF
jgi:hypothetical protein